MRRLSWQRAKRIGEDLGRLRERLEFYKGELEDRVARQPYPRDSEEQEEDDDLQAAALVLSDAMDALRDATDLMASYESSRRDRAR